MIPEYKNEALVRNSGMPVQPVGTRWYTDCGNSAGTAHLYVQVKDGMLIARCGRKILEGDRQPEIQALRYCKRCSRK